MDDWTTTLKAMFWLSVIVSVLGVVSLPLLLVRLPVDYFTRPRRRIGDPQPGRVVRIVIWVLRNVLAALLFVAGLIMLVTPGQGLLMLLASLWIAALPGKHRVERRLVGLPGVGNAVNRIRARFGVPPLELPANSL